MKDRFYIKDGFVHRMSDNFEIFYIPFGAEFDPNFIYVIEHAEDSDEARFIVTSWVNV